MLPPIPGKGVGTAAGRVGSAAAGMKPKQTNEKMRILKDKMAPLRKMPKMPMKQMPGAPMRRFPGMKPMPVPERDRNPAMPMKRPTKDMPGTPKMKKDY